MAVEIIDCDPTDTGIAKPVEKEPIKEPKSEDTDIEFIWTINGPRRVQEICWGLRRLSPLEDF